MKIIYVKTTETCNLDCDHCFTSGSKGKKGCFDPIATARWIMGFKGEQIHIEFHGGEPFLVPVRDLYQFWRTLLPMFGPTASFGTTTNLTYKLDEEKIVFMTDVLRKRIATSWDEGIRWKDKRQFDLWEKNVKTLISKGFHIKVFVSMNKSLMNRDPADVLKVFKDLGIKEVAFERITHNGNANRSADLFPTNKEIDDWIYAMHLVNDRKWFNNILLESIYAKFEGGNSRSSTFCRGCEQMMFTINADGTIAGCPNSAPTSHYASINDSFESVMNHESRGCMIAEEAYIDPRCTTCDVMGECGGDCYKLEWDSQCPAPRRLMYELNNQTDRAVQLQVHVL
ncbi:MAG: hypothetical protein NZ824_05460 [Candidatus Thioglobus sp.]|nr:hypothetical protein [Candidatus Thioglobus sp.]